MGSIPTPGANALIGSAEIGLDVQNASPPIASYIGKDDTLWLGSSSASTNPGYIISARILMPNGKIVPNQWVVTPIGSRNMTWRSVPLPEGFILSIAVSSTSSSSTTRTEYAQLVISRGNPQGGQIGQILCQGYPTNALPIAWPTGVNTTPIDCVGTIRSITGTTPAAGTDISETVPANAKWGLTTFFARFAASAAAGTRTIELVIDDSVNILQRIPVNTAPIATQVWNITWGQGIALSLTTAVGGVAQPLPQFIRMLPGWRIRTITAGLLAGDQWSLVQYSVEEWLLP